ncbi:Cof-type HAD-IIB family hydrolase [Macrococcus animalis]|uniref:Cof-type HAD-IIB family hydrolase n=1 Tax=Macrococcus animalis TaxID=3395467 RepID=UPI0039BEAB59
MDKGDGMFVFAVDMDGTLLNNDNEYNRVLFNRINNEYKGMFKFLVASSNTTNHLQSFFENDDIYFIGSNGAVIMYKGDILHTSYITENDVRVAIKYLERNSITSYVMSTLDTSFASTSASDVFIERMHGYYSDLNVSAKLNIQLVTKITIEMNDTEKDYTKNIIKDLNQALDNSIVVDSGFNCFDIINQNTNKSVAIHKVLDILGENVESLYTFGDSDNDIEMLQMTEHSYAMENANVRVKKIAKHICHSNENDGVLKTIETVLKKEL